jgi:hemerythrin-like domain-containing protein
MLRDKNLVPLSHGHQHTLALCVRIDRAMQAGDQDLNSWQAELGREFDREMAQHFSAEEQEVFPWAARFAELQDLVKDLVADHVLLRSLFSRAKALSLSAGDLEAFVESLAVHIRKEEAELFEGLQRVMTPAELAELGAALANLSKPSSACSLRPVANKNPPEP